MTGYINWIYISVGCCTVSADALDFNRKDITGTTACSSRITCFAKVVMQYMHRHSRINMRILQNTGGNHVVGSIHNLLCRLKHQFDLPLQLTLMDFQKLCCSKKGRCMKIMSAGMHFPIDRRKRQSCLFLHRKCIHIAANQKSLPAIRADNCTDTCFPDRLWFISIFS